MKRDAHLFHGFLIVIMAIALSGCRMPDSRSIIPASGLAPIYPRIWRTGDPWKEGNQCVFPQVASLHPKLRWERFPPANPDPYGVQDAEVKYEITKVTYELQIWETADDRPGPFVYGRNGLLEPIHKLETPLKPSTNYMWTVRARFLLDGQIRVTSWGWGQCYGKIPRGLPVDQNPNLYRFRTPAA